MSKFMDEFKKDVKDTVDKEIKTAYIYTRVSTEEQTEGYSLEAQVDEIEDYCRYRKISIEKKYCDAGITGTSIDKREALKDMLRDIKVNNIDAIIIWKLSRISRNMGDLVDIVKHLQKNDVVLISITDKIDTSTNMGRFFFYLVGAFAEMERENIVVQSRLGMKKRAEEGKWNGGKPAIGYDYSSEKGLIINEKEKQTVLKIFDMYTKQGCGYSRICRFLNNNLDEFSTKNNKSWSYATIKTILDNPVYAGYIRWGKQLNWEKERRKGTTNNYTLSEGIHESIISEELWELTREIRKGKKAPEKITNLHYLLSGLAKCPVCGASMVSHRTKGALKNGGIVYYRYYACSQWANKKAICKPNLVKAATLEDQVIKRISRFINSPNLYEILNKRLSNSSDTKELEAQLKLTEQKLKKNIGAEDKYYEYAADEEILKTLKIEKIKEKLVALNNEQMKLISEKNEITKQINNISNSKMDIEKITLVLQNFENLFSIATFEIQKTLIHSLIKEIKIKRSDRIEERLSEEIILCLNDINLMNFHTEEDQTHFEVTYDTAHLS
ncbi:MAG: hypothetical protein CVU84_15275 [Firmicutes bacterium HGW-Firmicutes-1]|jgi:site-specific DNA recombinase|nr:MAG: hypothetical protein CVU84_15275 [Firmicutes bacterium HGW-Firmicutes-1]